MGVYFALRVVLSTLPLATALSVITVTTEYFTCCTLPRTCAALLGGWLAYTWQGLAARAAGSIH